MALNARTTLYRDSSLKELLIDDGNDAALSAYERMLSNMPWAVYSVRRIYFAGRSDTCKAQHGDTCTTPRASCRDPLRKGTCWRSVRTSALGPRDAITPHLKQLAKEQGTTTTSAEDGIPRVNIREPGTAYPALQELLVAAPAGVHDKERKSFAHRWDQIAGTNTLPLDL